MSKDKHIKKLKSLKMGVGKPNTPKDYTDKEIKAHNLNMDKAIKLVEEQA